MIRENRVLHHSRALPVQPRLVILDCMATCNKT